MSNYLIHGGPGSGRYPLGSGDRPYQHRGGGFKNPFRKRTDEEKAQAKVQMGRALERSVKGGKDKPNVSPAEKAIKDTETALRSGKRLIETADRLQNKKARKEAYRKELEKAKAMSNQDLQQIITRRSLENQYMSGLDINTMSEGKQKIMDVLDVAGDIAGFASAIVGTAATVYMLKNR